MPGSAAPGAAVADNLDRVRRRIDAAAHRAHRSPSDIQLVAVSKTFSADFVRAAHAAGQHIFGENRVQEGLGKIGNLTGLDLEWHLIGHLQSNKARKAVQAFACIQSIDSRDLLAKVEAAATEAGVRPRVLVQVDLAGETTKFGAAAPAAEDLVRAALDSRGVQLRGLMTIPPIPVDPEDSRPWFRRLREIRDGLVASGIPHTSLADLSMGMSHDFEIAIEEGATIVRVGTAVFGSRPPLAAGVDRT